MNDLFPDHNASLTPHEQLTQELAENIRPAEEIYSEVLAHIEQVQIKDEALIKTINFGTEHLKSFNVSVRKQIEKELATPEGFKRIIGKIAETPLTELPVSRGMRAEKKAQEFYLKAQYTAQSLLKHQYANPGESTKTLMKMPVSHSHHSAAKIILNAIFMQYSRGKWLQENVYNPALKCMYENTYNKLYTFLKQHHPHIEYQPPEVLYESKFNFECFRGDHKLGIYHLKLQQAVMMLPVQFNRSSLKQLEDTILHEMIHAAFDHQKTFLYRDAEGQLFEIKFDEKRPKISRQFEHFIEKISQDYNHAKNTLAELEKFNAQAKHYGFSFKPCQLSHMNNVTHGTKQISGGNIGLRQNLRFFEKSKAKILNHAFEALDEGLAEVIALEIDFKVKQAENLGQKPGVIRTARKNDLPYYREIGAYNPNAQALMQSVFELFESISLNDFIIAAASPEGMLRLQDLLMQEPKLTAKTGMERLAEFALLVQQRIKE